MLRLRAQFNSRNWRLDWSLYVILTFLAILTYIPMIFTLFNSFKENSQFNLEFWLPMLPFHFENYVKAFPSVGQAILNSLSYSIPTLILTLIFSSLAGYAFARFRFPGKQSLFFAMLALLMIPGILLVVPMLSIVVNFRWNDTIQGVVLPWTAIEIVFGTFMMRTFFETLPREYFEAARIDGADEITLLFRIAMPLAMPALSTMAILNLLFTWNELIWPLVTISDPARTPVAIAVLAFSGEYYTDYGATFASYVLASLPLIIIFSIFSKRFMEGLSGGLSV